MPSSMAQVPTEPIKSAQRGGSRIVFAASAALALLLPVGPSQASWPNDPNVNMLVAPSASNQFNPSLATDGAQGIYVAWPDGRGGPLAEDIYVQRISANGDRAPGWPSSGLLVCGAAGEQTSPELAPDGSGGVFVAWVDGRISLGDQDIYLSHVLANGTLAPGWPVNGLQLTTLAGRNESGVVLAPDGSGGVYAAWSLVYTPNIDDDIYGAHVTGAGVITFAGAVLGMTNFQESPSIVGDGFGNAFVACINDDYGGTPGGWEPMIVKINTLGIWLVSPTGISNPSVGTFTYVPSPLAADLSGGVYLAYRGGSFDNLVVQHLTAALAPAPGNWSSTAMSITNQSTINPVSAPFMVGDGSGGAMLAWSDTRSGPRAPFALRLVPGGYVSNGWAPSGSPAGFPPGAADVSGLVSDGSGGALVVWPDNRSGVNELYAARLSATGKFPSGWNPSGNAVATAGKYNAGDIVADGQGGLIAAFSVNDRSAYRTDYVQNIDGFGVLGDARPHITRIADVPNDQGGAISLQWTASDRDAMPWRTITEYSIWRRVPSAVLAERALYTSRPGRRALRTTVEDGVVVYWEHVTDTPARMFPGYSEVVPTTVDSMATGNPRTSLMVLAESADAAMFWASTPDSGYSVDNLPPHATAQFLGTYAGGVAALHWAPVLAPDLANYRLYRGTSPSFTPGPGNLVATPTDTSYTDPAGLPACYRVSAVDTHGNEGPSTLLIPAGALGVDPHSITEVSLGRPVPSPARLSCVLRYALPREAGVRLAIYDVSGRLVRTLVDGSVAAGEHDATWDLRGNDGRRLGGGLYFGRLEAMGRIFTQRILTLQ